jgi:hypothetical protein
MWWHQCDLFIMMDTREEEIGVGSADIATKSHLAPSLTKSRKNIHAKQWNGGSTS